MNSLVDYSAHYAELVSYFASYLRDMSAAISQVKSLAYSLINIPQPPIKHASIGNDIGSVMAACKRAHDDIKRTQSILRGHVKGKDSPASSRVILSTNKVQPITPVKCDEIEQERPEKEEVGLSTRADIELPLRQAEREGDNEWKLKCIPNQQATPISSKPKHSKQRSQSETKGRPQDIEHKIETLRLSRNRDLHIFASENDECLSLIQKIRNQLRIKIK